jgi:pyridoxine 5-phosphate synthase
MRNLILSLDPIPALRDAAFMQEVDLSAAASLAELAGVAAVRLGVGEDLRPVTERDVVDLRRTARSFELRMPASQSLLKVALEARPDRVILAGEGAQGGGAAAPLDLRANAQVAGSVIRSLGESGIAVAALVSPEIDVVKASHALGVRGIEFFTGGIIDLPESERRAGLERLSDATRVASKLRFDRISVGGGLDFYAIPEVLAAAPAIEIVTVGRSLVARSLLVGLDRAIRDCRALLI